VVKDYDQDILIEGNAEKLSLAFLNLIVNAIEATKKGEGKIWITAYRVSGEIKVIITDNGTGMEPDVARHMFDKNFSSKPKGLGVGLCHVKQILEWHNATVSVISEPGTGTSVIVAFKAIDCN
jgi:signal transduction histidine kinase